VSGGTVVATKESILAHCITRAVIADEGGIDAATAKYGPKVERLSTWSALKAAAKATPKASRVSAFVVMWAIAMQLEDRDEFTITEYQRYWNENERQAYRLQKEFRELWPEFETPDELARQIVKHVNKRLSKKEAASLPMTAMVTV
jgi:hypothetical protein